MTFSSVTDAMEVRHMPGYFSSCSRSVGMKSFWTMMFPSSAIQIGFRPDTEIPSLQKY